jgi:hypothetical protein
MHRPKPHYRLHVRRATVVPFFWCVVHAQKHTSTIWLHSSSLALSVAREIL